MIIYKITNSINSKIYIGQTMQNLAHRWHEHSRPHRGRNKIKSAISAAIRKYGKENFKIEQIDSAKTIEELNIMESTYIKAFNSLSPNGYNLEIGGRNKTCHSETREKISQTLKGRKIANRCTQGNKTPRTQEQKDHLSRLIKGVPNVVLYKPVEAIETGQCWGSISGAAKDLGLNRATIWSLLKSGKKGRCGLSFRLKVG